MDGEVASEFVAKARTATSKGHGTRRNNGNKTHRRNFSRGGMS